ncbi:ATP-grasp domain-containing protein [Vreelandella rituensis]|uniref:ATP-grasp domain-containing protein n=1 Tax=Vreelandella rituensis TaxID=2282306 RepID=A0A368UBR1_9GAMM|nr:ATP-grasp domain-containing protein [Halomonas rituensis]RCV92823.1 ATP-grasp domain-containing protein [Halomonas rituensis]
MKRNVFVIALEEQQRKEFQTIRRAQAFNLYGVLDVATAVESADKFSFNELLEKARKEIASHECSVDAIVAHWDFPTSVMVPLLCKEQRIPSPSVESVLKCEHKYWSRLEQNKVIPECVPDFCSINPFEKDPFDQVTLDYPFWLKPVKAFSSQLGFKIENKQQFDEAINTMRDDIRHFGDPFNEALDKVELPPEIEERDGNTCIAEKLIDGVQAAPEGTMFHGEFNVHGIISQPCSTDSGLFDRLEYPSNLPENIHRRMILACKKFLKHIDFDNGCFNAEFMWDENDDKLWLIEVNTRISQSHSEIFIMVDGMSNHEVAIDIALGERPSLPNREGPYPVAAKCYIPYQKKDGIVTGLPTQEEIEKLKNRFPGLIVKFTVEKGTRLSELVNQNAFCYQLGTLFIPAESHEQLNERYMACLEALEFKIDPIHQ